MCLALLIRSTNVGVGRRRPAADQVHGVHDAVRLRRGGRGIFELAGDVVGEESLGEHHDRLAALDESHVTQQTGEQHQKASRIAVRLGDDRLRVLLDGAHECQIVGRIASRLSRGRCSTEHFGGRALGREPRDDAREDQLIASDDLIGLVDAHRAHARQIGSLERASHPRQLRDRRVHIRRESDLRAWTRQRENGDAVARPHARFQELLRGNSRSLLVAGCDVLLIEDEDVQMAARSTAIGRYLAKHRPLGHVAIRTDRFFDVLEEDDGRQSVAVGDDEFVSAEIFDGNPMGVDDAHVHPHEVDRGPERGRRRLRDEVRRCRHRQHRRHNGGTCVSYM